MIMHSLFPLLLALLPATAHSQATSSVAPSLIVSDVGPIISAVQSLAAEASSLNTMLTITDILPTTITG
jgi:hypothetical protein